MKRWAFFTITVLLLTAGCGGDKPRFTEEEMARIPLPQRTDLPEISGGVVLSVGSETVSAEQIAVPAIVDEFRPLIERSSFEQFKAEAKPQLEEVVVLVVSDILLRQQARKDSKGNIEEGLDKAADSEMKRFIARFRGDYAKAEEALRAEGLDWLKFREYQKKLILSQYYRSTKQAEERPVTHDELQQRYEEMKKSGHFAIEEKLTFRLIDIEIAKVQVTSSNLDRTEQAKKLAADLLERLKKGENFAALAKEYSHGHRASVGGLWKPVRPDSLAKPYDILAEGARQMEPGQTCEPIEAGGHIFIMKLEEKQSNGFKPFEQVQKLVESQILNERRRQGENEFRKRLVEQAKIADKDSFVDFCLMKIYQTARQEAS